MRTFRVEYPKYGDSQYVVFVKAKNKRTLNKKLSEYARQNALIKEIKLGKYPLT